jgi:hypothetical protein
MSVGNEQRKRKERAVIIHFQTPVREAGAVHGLISGPLFIVQ